VIRETGLDCWEIQCLIAVVLLAALCPTSARGDTDEGWPREIETAEGLVVMYQPQLDRLDGDILEGRAAMMVGPPNAGEPVFGAAWIKARILTDLDSRMVTLEDISIPQVRFPELPEERAEKLIALLTSAMPTWEIELSLDRLVAALELADRESQAAEGFDDSPPEILFREEPSVLVTIDGTPQLREIPDTGVQGVTNSPFLIVQDPQNKNDFYLYAGSGTWYRAPSAEGPWAVTQNVPKQILQLQPEEEAMSEEEASEGPNTPPVLVVSTKPAELIVTDGPPEYTPIANGELLIISNSESDVLREVETQQIYVLLSGRWFTSRSTAGPWKVVHADELPGSFANIDPDGDYGYLLVWVAGTEMANEAALDAAVPQTAAVKRDATIQVSYDGEPRFEPVEETQLQYAVNTESQVIRSGSEYYCVKEGIWYVASDPKGPWQVATKVPKEIRAIPPSSPVYNTKYVYVYDATPEVVYVGYYPGYTNSYIYHGVPVYGTGWYYRPWWGPYHYYPRYRTWGFNVRYNPWYGWSFGFSYSTGPFTFSMGYGGHGGWWGPGGYRGYRYGYQRGWHQGYRAGARAGYYAGYRAGRHGTARNMYNSSNNASRVAYTRDRGRASAATLGAAAGKTPVTAADRANNLYADKNGNVYRRQQDGSWQQHANGAWKNTDPGGGAASRPATLPEARSQQRPETRPQQLPDSRPQQLPSSGSLNRSGSDLNRSHHARQRGNQRARSAPRGGGGARRR
jgi:hypothetical protein